MRPFQTSDKGWINLDHVTDWRVERWGVDLNILSYHKDGAAKLTLEGKWATRFIAFVTEQARLDYQSSMRYSVERK